MTPTWVQLAYLVAAVCFILALKGLSSPKSARNGNLIGAVGALIAVAVTFFSGAPMGHLVLILVAIVIGTAIGWPAARRVKMTAMPQLVALFNGVGGGAAALVAVIEYLSSGGAEAKGALAATVFTVLIGSVSFSGSILTFMKLQEVMTTRPVVIPGGRYITVIVAAASLVAAVWLIISLCFNDPAAIEI